MTMNVIGQPLPRVDGHAKVTGSARYAADFNQKGQAYAVIVSATVGLGRINRIDSAEVEDMPGIIAPTATKCISLSPTTTKRCLCLSVRDMSATAIKRYRRNAEECRNQAELSFRSEHKAHWLRLVRCSRAYFGQRTAESQIE